MAKLWLEFLEERTAPAITISSLTNTSVFGELILFTGTAAQAGDNVNIEDATGSVKVLISGLANSGAGSDYSLAVAIGDVGAHLIRAHDTTNGDISPLLSEIVNKGDSSTTINASAQNSGSGQAVTFTASLHAAPPAAGVPTGTVAFRERERFLGSGTVDATGRATFTTATLSTGSHSINAVYEGDGNFLGSASGNWLLTVETATATAVSCSPNPSLFNQPVSVTARVTSTTQGTVPPAGAVTFLEGTTVLAANVIASAGQAVFSTTALAVGSHTIAASFTGTDGFADSSGTSLPQVVGRASTITSATASPKIASYGQAMTLSASIASSATGAGAPTGTVTFRDGSKSLGTVTLVGNGYATLAIATLGVGYHMLSASYSGDGHFNASASPALSVGVGTPTTVKLISSPRGSVFGQPVTFTATLATLPAGATPKGMVAFREGTTVLAAQVSLSAAGQAVFSTAALGVGTHTITASYAGSGNFLPSSGSDVASPQVVGRDATAIAIAASPDPSTHATAVTFTATVGALAPGAGAPGGAVTFVEGTAVLGIGAVSAGGRATFSTAALSSGYHSVSAAYAGDGHFTASTSVAWTATVMSQTATLVRPFPAHSAYGQYVQVIATVTAKDASAGTPLGTVTFREGTTVLAANVPLAGGLAIFSTAVLPAGTHTFTATYSPLSIFLASSGNTAGAPQVVTRAASWTAVASSASPAARGQAVTFTATIAARAPGFGVPSGIVTFAEGARALAARTLDATGRATFSTASLSIGKHTITAFYRGNSNFLTSSGSDADYPEVIVPYTSTATLTSSPNPAALGQVVTFTATVTSGGGTPTGTVDFTDSALTGVVPQIWFTPNQDSDILPLFQRPQDWKAARSHVAVFKLEEFELETLAAPYLGNTWQRLQSAKVVQILKAWNIAFAFDAGVIKQQYLSDPTAAVRDAEAAIANVAAAGGAVKYVAMDEPYVDGSIKFASMSASAIEDRVASFMKSITSYDPSVRVGDIEAYPALDVPTIEAYISGLSARGTTPAFFHLDINFGFLNTNPSAAAKMRVDLPILRNFFVQKKIPFGIIFWNGGASTTSDEDYSSVALSNLDEVKAAMGAPPQAIFQSWVPNSAGDFVYPSNLPETQPYTHTWLLDQGLQHLLSTTLAILPLHAGVATFSTARLSAGAHTITASYSGDANFTASARSDRLAPEVIHTAMASATIPVPQTSVEAAPAVSNSGARVNATPGRPASALLPAAVDMYFASTPRVPARAPATLLRPRTAVPTNDWLTTPF
jgi:hypothetical protein